MCCNLWLSFGFNYHISKNLRSGLFRRGFFSFWKYVCTWTCDLLFFRKTISKEIEHSKSSKKVEANEFKGTFEESQVLRRFRFRSHFSISLRRVWAFGSRNGSTHISRKGEAHASTRRSAVCTGTMVIYVYKRPISCLIKYLYGKNRDKWLFVKLLFQTNRSLLISFYRQIATQHKYPWNGFTRTLYVDYRLQLFISMSNDTQKLYNIWNYLL